MESITNKLKDNNKRNSLSSNQSDQSELLGNTWLVGNIKDFLRAILAQRSSWSETKYTNISRGNPLNGIL